MAADWLPRVFSGSLKWAVVGFWVLSTGIVIYTATRGLRPILLLVPVFAVLAVGTARGWWQALLADLVLLGLQLIGVAGSAYELFQRGGGDKGAQLRAIGVDPFYGVLVNLVVALLATGLFAWALGRIRGAARQSD